MIVRKYYNMITLDSGEDFVCEAEVNIADHFLTVHFTTASENDLRFFEIQKHDEGYYLFQQPDVSDEVDMELSNKINQWYQQLEELVRDMTSRTSQN